LGLGLPVRRILSLLVKEERKQLAPQNAIMNPTRYFLKAFSISTKRWHQELCWWVKGLPGWLLCLLRFIFSSHDLVELKVRVSSSDGLVMVIVQILMSLVMPLMLEASGFVGFLCDHGLSTGLVVDLAMLMSLVQ
jgi:hypothetical protein